ncbi:MAG TPA: DUF1330 domain-containing protein [Acidimicrobiales bacterium]|nr:DUF1330 domain-containing protein [Acidimicrobiales bacterium]
MSKGYVIFTEGPIQDQASMDAYGQKSFPSMMQAGGRLLVADDAPEVLEGAWGAARTVIIEFDSVDAARAWYTSPEYQASIPLRHAAADTEVVLMSGFEMPGH